MLTDATVKIIENGRDGEVRYSESPSHVVKGYWEFGINDVVTIVNMGSREEWQRSHAWAAERRAAILRSVADEVIRLRAPTCRAEVDEESGRILVRQGTAADPSASASQAKAAAFVRRYSTLKLLLGGGVLVIMLILGGVMWLRKQVLPVAKASGVPLDECVRTENHITTLLQATDPHLPEISGRGGNTTTSISILVIPLDGSDPQVVHVVGGLEGGSYSLARIMGSDGRTMWFDAAGLYGVRLSDYELITPGDLRKANPSVDPGWWEDPRGMDIVDGELHIINNDRSAAMDLDPVTWKATSVEPKPSNSRFERHAITDHLAAGFITGANSWIGLHSPSELEREFAAKKFLRRVVPQEEAKQMRRFHRGVLEDPVDEKYHRILSMTELNETEYFNAAFLRMDDTSEPLRMSAPDGALMIYTSAPGLQGTLMVARVDTEGKIIWEVDTGIDRFTLSQILPGQDSFAFVGTRPPIPDKLSEPLLVFVENNTGRVTTHSLWQ